MSLPPFARDSVVEIAAEDDVVAVSRFDQVLSPPCVGEVASIYPRIDIAGRIGVGGVAKDKIVAVASVYDVVAVASHQCVIACGAVNFIIAFSSKHHVVFLRRR